MDLILHVVDGPRKGRTYRAVSGVTIGRNRADINLEDSKASSIHAKIDETEEGELVLIDNGSRNGIIINEQRVASLKLTPNLVFRIGRSDIRIEVEEGTGASVVKSTKRTWQDHLKRLTEKMLASDLPTPNSIQPMSPVVTLTFTQGAQLKTRWILGYGPRSAGPSSLDLPIYERKAPGICFEIKPSLEGPVFLTDFPKDVLINKRSQERKVLATGDEIRVGYSVLTVKLMEN